MKNTSLVSALVATTVCLAACGAPPSMAPADGGPLIELPQGTASLTVDITNVHSANGTVSCGLFNAAAGFPGASPIDGGAIHQPASTGVMHCRYDHLPAGTYAVSVVHDENDDGMLNRNFVGAPTEGYGATNNMLPATSAPTFDASSVQLADGQQLTTQVTLRY